MKADAAVVEDIVQACRHVADFVAGLTAEGFRQSVLVQSAVIRQIEVIGEAARRLSPEFRRAHEAIPWKRVVGMRDRLIHGYDDVDMAVVWQVAMEEVPALLHHLKVGAPDVRPIEPPSTGSKSMSG